MRNALPSSLPVPSQFYNIGNNGARMSYLDVLMQMETKGNVLEDALPLESKIFNNGNQLRDGVFAIPYQSHFNSDLLQDYQFGSSNYDNYFQQSFESDIQNLENGKKHPIEVHQDLALNEWKQNKRKKMSCFEQYQSTDQIIETLPETNDFRLNMPVRRSQKLSDKITALQKLVSPYGKADTASVLQEASLHIKLLQEQIQNLFQMLSSSYNSVRAIHPQDIGNKQEDLRSRGLCLVPISYYTQKVTKEEKPIDINSVSRKNNHF